MNIVVLCGGISTEREISIVSGTGVCKALRSLGHKAILLDVFFGSEEVDLMDAFPEMYDVDEAAAFIRSNDPFLEIAVANRERSFFGPNVTRLCKMSDIVFLALHGENGENGKVQAAFDLLRIKYTGTGYLSSAMAMDKSLTKTVLKEAGVPVPHSVTIMRDDAMLPDLTRAGLHFPLVVKVVCGGSSVGVYIVHNDEEYLQALKEAFVLEPKVIVEDYIAGREFSVGVIEGKALPVIEIAPKEGFYDYKNKYTAGAVVETCPADLSEELTRKMQRYAEEAYHALLMQSYARMDFMMDSQGEFYCLEANTLPGMTPTSLMPQEAAVVGMDYPAFCQKLIDVSFAKYGER